MPVHPGLRRRPGRRVAVHPGPLDARPVAPGHRVVQAQRRNEKDSEIQGVQSALDLNALTIGFARRFATYKRAGLVLQDFERLIQLVNAADRPSQFIFAGKAHPEDHYGKELIQNIVRLTRQEPFGHHIVFVEDPSRPMNRERWPETPSGCPAAQP